MGNRPVNFSDPTGHEPKYGCYSSAAGLCLNANGTAIKAGRGKPADLPKSDNNSDKDDPAYGDGLIGPPAPIPYGPPDPYEYDYSHLLTMYPDPSASTTMHFLDKRYISHAPAYLNGEIVGFRPIYIRPNYNNYTLHKEMFSFDFIARKVLDQSISTVMERVAGQTFITLFKRAALASTVYDVVSIGNEFVSFEGHIEIGEFNSFTPVQVDLQPVESFVSPLNPFIFP